MRTRNYTCKNGEAVNAWKIFLADSDNIYLISDDYIHKDYIPDSLVLRIIDHYADKFLLSMLKDVKVNITIITSSNSYLNNNELQENISIIKKLLQ